MVRVITGTTLKRNDPVTVPSTTTLKSVLEEGRIDYANARIHLDGSPLSAGDLNKTFADFGITEGTCFLLNVVKADNAA